MISQRMTCGKRICKLLLLNLNFSENMDFIHPQVVTKLYKVLSMLIGSFVASLN